MEQADRISVAFDGAHLQIKLLKKEVRSKVELIVLVRGEIYIVKLNKQQSSSEKHPYRSKMKAAYYEKYLCLLFGSDL